MNFWVVPGYEGQLLGAEGPDWMNLAGEGRALLIKSNRRRKIWQVQLDKLNVYVKRYEAGGVVGWAKRLFLSSPAAVEFKNHQLARAAGLNCPAGLAFGQRGWRGTGGASILITAAVSPAEALDVYLENNPLDDELLKLVAELMGKSHRAGMVHPDPHLGNFLVRMGSDGQRELILVDLQKLHRITATESARPNRAGVRNLGRCYGGVRDYLERKRQEKFLGEFLTAAGVVDPKHIQELQVKIERVAWRESLRRWVGRDRRSRGDNKYFRRIGAVKNWKGSVLLRTKRPVPGSEASKSEFTAEQWQKALEDPAGLFVGAETVKDSGDSLTVQRRLKVEQVELDVHCKLFRRAGGLRRPPAQRAYETGFVLLNRRISTVMPLAWLSKGTGLYNGESILITETVPGAICLAKFNSNEEEVATGMAELEAELGRYGFIHCDLRPSNVLVKCSADGRKQLIVSHCESIRRANRFALGRLGLVGRRRGSRPG